MKYYLLHRRPDGFVDLYGPYDSTNDQRRRAFELFHYEGARLDSLTRICGEVIGPLEADVYSELELL